MRWQSAIDSHVYDDDLKHHIDFTSGIFVANVGHANKAVGAAIRNVDFFHTYTYGTDIRDYYIERLLARNPGFDACALFCSGCEAVEAALRVMRARSPIRQAVLWVDGNFHGRTQGAAMRMYACKMSWPKNGEQPDVPVMLRFCCAVILESYRGWDARFYPEGFVEKIQQLCVEHDLLLCMDEIQAGFGRTGKFWGHEHYPGCKPDLICFGKAVGGGVPLSGLLGRKELFEGVELTSTHGGHPLGCAAGLAVLNEIDRLDLVSESARKGEFMHQWLRKELPDVEIQGHGMVGALLTDSVNTADHIVDSCRKYGLLVVQTSRPSVKLGPPLVISDEDLLAGLQILKQAVHESI